MVGMKREHSDSSKLEAASGSSSNDSSSSSDSGGISEITASAGTIPIVAEAKPPEEAQACKLGVKELLGIAEAFGIDTSRCLERSDLVKKLADEGLFEGT